MKFLKEFNSNLNEKPKVNKSFLKLSDVRERILSYYKNNFAIKTYISNKSSYDNFIRIIGNKYISQISKSDIEEFKNTRSKEVNLISTNIDIRNIKTIFNRLVEFELLEFSKLSTVKQFKIESKKM